MIRFQNDLKVEDPKDFSLGIFFGIVALRRQHQVAKKCLFVSFSPRKTSYLARSIGSVVFWPPVLEHRWLSGLLVLDKSFAPNLLRR
jgi:hypothetical protein